MDTCLSNYVQMFAEGEEQETRERLVALTRRIDLPEGITRRYR